MPKLTTLSILALLIATPAVASTELSPEKPWFEKLSLRGYTQVRYNRLLEDNPDLVCEACDRSLGNEQSFFIRRARIVLSGEVHERVSVSIQTDLAADASDTNRHFAQLRDAYFDLYLTADRAFRLRLGQSKVPFGWENMQSSGNRLAFDRSDAINSGVANERDLGGFIYYSPPAIRERFASLANPIFKGTGDYGMVGIGAYNGQTVNRPELNNNRHLVARVAYPLEVFGDQVIEPSLQAYSGQYTLSSRTPGVRGPDTFRDRRVAASLVLYPAPFGFQLEAVAGKGPEYVLANDTIELHDQSGGYAQVMYRIPLQGEQNLMSYARAQYFDGGKKTELDARHHRVTQYDIGLEWQPLPAFELTAELMLADRRTSDGTLRLSDEEGHRLRLQAQFNY